MFIPKQKKTHWPWVFSILLCEEESYVQTRWTLQNIVDLPHASVTSLCSLMQEVFLPLHKVEKCCKIKAYGFCSSERLKESARHCGRDKKSFAIFTDTCTYTRKNKALLWLMGLVLMTPLPQSFFVWISVFLLSHTTLH